MSPLPPEQPTPATLTPDPPPLAVGICLLALNWFVPGAAFCLRGRWARGAAQLAMVCLTFGLGVWLTGGVVWPNWDMRSPNFNLINNIMFCAQMLAGLPSLLSLYGEQHAALGWLAGKPMDPYFELGGLYLVFAGTINYFGACNFHDRFLRRGGFQAGGRSVGTAATDPGPTAPAEAPKP